ncbi:MAG: polysaccharide deacetylase family protein, partial [Bacillota bacterium]
LCLTALMVIFITASAERRYVVQAGDGDVITNVPTTEKVIALTFDDGPSPTFTPQILAILKEQCVSATFFIVGMRVDSFPDVAREIVSSGNEIGNHTYSHPLKQMGAAQFERELTRAHETIREVTGVETKIYRPPGAYYNKTTLAILKKHDYTMVLWSWWQNAKDYANPGVDVIVGRILDDPQNGDIIVLHDCGGNRSQTVEALPKIIKGLKEKGFKLVTVSELLSRLNPGPGDIIPAWRAKVVRTINVIRLGKE